MTHSAAYRRILQKMGYYNYQQGLIFRHLEQEGGWNSHLQNCRNFILKAVSLGKPRKVTVLGSGWLLDLPLREIMEFAEEVRLIDIVHPPEVREQAGALEHVSLAEEDITGGLIQEVWTKAGRRSVFNRLRSLDNIMVPEYQTMDDPGMVLSLNILTQLESLPLMFIKKRSAIDEESLFRFRQEVQKKHIDFLKKHRSVLITDTVEIIKDKSGDITEEPSLIVDLPEATNREEWTWHFEKTRSDYYTRRSDFRVVALLI
ncbi:MAG: hypothetical protein K0B05_06055 [Bacteroidales bacterium]|nr:hypothetical protein [Bacteroidales bacterium]